MTRTGGSSVSFFAGMFLALLAMTGCGSSDGAARSDGGVDQRGTGGSGGTGGTGGGAGLDAGGDALLPADARLVEAGCDPVAQGCGPGMKCDFVCDGTIPELACVQDPPAGALIGEPCSTTILCARGGGCFENVTTGELECVKYCSADGECPQGMTCQTLVATVNCGAGDYHSVLGFCLTPL